MFAHKSRQSKPPKHIVITGASSGIGQALAEYYAAPDVVLGLTGRNKERLEQVSSICQEKGASVTCGVVDVSDEKAMADWLTSFDDQFPIDLVIANAGISGGTGDVMFGEDQTQVRRIFEVNLFGVLHTIQPIQQKMTDRGAGHLAIVSSLAGYRGWPGAPAYCASKAAVRVYGEGLRGALDKTGVRVSVICPGFVRSRMTDVNEFPMPFIMDTAKAARHIALQLAKGKGRISFPFIPAFFAWVFMVLPNGIAHRWLLGMPKKRPSDV